MFPFLLGVFLIVTGPAPAPRIANSWTGCEGCAGTGPECELVHEEGGAALYNCYVPRCDGFGPTCSYHVATGGNSCWCWEWDSTYGIVNIPCPFNDCDHGTCKTCNIEKPAISWGKVKGLYR